MESQCVNRGGSSNLDEDSHEILEEVQPGGEVQAEVVQAGAQRLQQLLWHRHIPPQPAAPPHGSLSPGQVFGTTSSRGK